jgi:hypothetical protein
MAAEYEEYNEEKEHEIISRMGYPLKDLARSFTQVLSESGPIATGKVLHYTADMITSGGLLLWEKLIWDYSYEHIGVASPRIFLYLNKKFRELEDMGRKTAFDAFCKTPLVQETAAEIALIVQDCPKRTKTKYPSVPPDTHENEEWLRSVLQTTDRTVVRRVWQRNTDLDPMLHAANEMIYAITGGATERALFWVKWLIEEDNLLRKKFGQGLTTMERGPAHLKPQQKASVGYYLINVLAECYKEMSEKGMMRMHQEFQALLDLYRSSDSMNTHKRRMDTIAIMVQLLTDVPKWRVPASPSLVKDTTVLQRAVSQAPSFFQEVLKYPLPAKLLPAKVSGLKQKKAKDPSKAEKLQAQLDLIDQAAMSFYKM